MPSILERETARAQTREIRDLGGPVLRKVIDEAVGAFERCSQTADDGDENLGILMPFHHAIEMLDGAEVLLDQSCVVASHATLRSAFEASLGVRYVLQDDMQRRALCYVAGDIRERIRWYEEHDPDTNRGANFHAEMGIDANSDYPMPVLEDVRRGAASLREMLDGELYSAINEEYERAGERRRRPAWYSLFNGPQNVRELAKRLGKLDDYLIMYRRWSLTAHATDLYRQLTKLADGTGPAVRVIRSPWGIADAYELACQIGVEITSPVLAHYRPGESKRFAKWYLTEVGPVTERLSAIKEEEA